MSQPLSDEQSERLLREILAADSEDRVVTILRKAGFWDDDAVWRLYGDDPKNFSPAGNQQQDPDAALVEKLINSVDARLMRRCMEANIDPESDAAPQTMREAVAVFYEGATAGKVREHQGLLTEWTEKQRTDAAREMAVSLTGPTAGSPSVTVVDEGEGQAPEHLPDTILSTRGRWKETIPFVQGKWNMGGTGALPFCGALNLQLVISKKAPVLAAQQQLSTDWGFTVVRREYPEGKRFVSVYRYLAPVNASERLNEGDVLRVSRRTLPLFPDGPKPYVREVESGTLIKLYEYGTKARNIFFRKGGLQERLDLLMPGVSLPMRLHECRPFKGEQERSFETTLNGLLVRLGPTHRRKEHPLEDDFPDSSEIVVAGERIGVLIFAFKSGRAATYRRGEGILFVVNGQTHAPLPARFFSKKNVGMDYLSDSLLVLLDCSELSSTTREQLFLNSRDRLRPGKLLDRIMDDLADMIKNHVGLRELREQRRAEEKKATLADAKPMEEVLKKILQRNPTFASLFLKGLRLSNPYALADVPTDPAFQGKKHPAIFKFKGRAYGEVLKRSCNLGQRLRLTFETDAENNYFARKMNPGKMNVEAWLEGSPVDVDYSRNLSNGFAHLNVHLPSAAKAGNALKLVVEVVDPTLIDPFVNIAELAILPAVPPSSGPARPPTERPTPHENGNKQQQPTGIDIPIPEEVTKERWEKFGMDQHSALRVQASSAADEGLPAYDFYLNVDNVYLQSEIKASKASADLLKERFKWGMALLGLGAMHRELRNEQDPNKDGGDDENEDQPIDMKELIAAASDALAPVLLPMIDSLGQLGGSAFAIRGDDDVTTAQALIAE